MNEWAEAAMEKGIEKGLAPFLRILRLKVGNPPPEVEKRIHELSKSQLEELADATLTFASLSDLQEWLGRHI